MFSSMWVSATGMRSAQRAVDTTAHNVANVNTMGFKNHQLSFAELAHARIMEINPQPLLQPLVLYGPETAGVQFTRGHGVQPGERAIDESPGPLVATGRPEDLAVKGTGYFVVDDETGDARRYTRAGIFGIDAEQYLVHASGRYLLDDDGERFIVPDDATGSILVSADGWISIGVDGEHEERTLGRLGLMVPDSAHQLHPVGDSLYELRDVDGEVVTGAVIHPGTGGIGHVRQGHLEGSNVQLAEEIVQLILAQRAFQLNGRVLQTADQMLELASSIRR